MIKVPPSTIAMSAVSLLCKTGPIPRDGLPTLFASRGYPVAAPDVDEAVEMAIERGLLKASGVMLASKLPPGWTVVDRDRTATGTPKLDGWKAWIAQNMIGERKPVLELIEGATE